MPWLIEAFLDEDYFEEAENATEERDNDFSTGHGKRHRIYNDGSHTNDNKIRSRDEEKLDIQSFYRNGKEHDTSADRERYIQNKHWAEKRLPSFNKQDKERIAQAAEAKARYDKKHAKKETKPVNASADIVELLQ